jgi:plasmid maintenance system antidote protein VapI
MSISAFADKHDLPRSATSDALNGGRRATDAMIAALVAELGGSDEQWRTLLDESRRDVRQLASS